MRQGSKEKEEGRRGQKQRRMKVERKEETKTKDEVTAIMKE